MRCPICGRSRVKKFRTRKKWEVKVEKVKCHPQKKAWKERFHQNMFDAVALGVMGATRR